MERPDFFTLKNGEKAKLPFTNKEYNQRVNKLRTVMEKNNFDMVVLGVVLLKHLYEMKFDLITHLLPKHLYWLLSHPISLRKLAFSLLFMLY